MQARLRPLYELFVNKWYFDEAIDLLVVRPAAAAGRFANDTFERLFVDETLVGGTSGLVRAGSAAVRAAQSGFVRYYAALLVLGVTGVGFYFLLSLTETLMPPLSILIWLPRPAACSALLPRACSRARCARASAASHWSTPGVLALAGSLAALALAIGYIVDYKPGTAGLQHVTDVVWISELGIHYKLGIDGLNVFLLGLTTLAVRRRRAGRPTCARRPTRPSARGSSTSTSCSPSPPCSAPSWPRTWRCSWRSST